MQSNTFLDHQKRQKQLQIWDIFKMLIKHYCKDGGVLLSDDTR